MRDLAELHEATGVSNITVQVEGAKQLRRQLMALGGIRLRRLAKSVVGRAMSPVIASARAGAPVGPTGRLRASLGKIVGANRRGDAFTARVGTRRDFTYRSTSGVKMVSGRGKIRDRALAKGHTQDKKTAQQYARLIEFGYDKSGRLRRKAGGAHFLDDAILSHQVQLIGTVTSELRRYVDSPPA
jgi:Bacteriophage HK97-gp10, putative tail-component